MKRIGLGICFLALLGFTPPSPGGEKPAGFLKLAGKNKAGQPKAQSVPYTPREGDLVFYDDRNLMWMVLFAYAGTGPPLHMGMVVKTKAGKFAILEAGPDDTVRVELLDLDKRLGQFQRDFKGIIQIRRCKKTLTAEQSKALTRFAHAQAGKRYAIGRLLLQGTWLRSRGPLREWLLGATVLDRDSWICSELSVAAGTVVKLFDPKVVHANVAYPLDLVNNERYDLSATWHDAAVWQLSQTKDAKAKK
ncbi:MAG: hypothetical protein HYX68_05990 [Planctomycetes bacterium]|nr:hypothetical protein [Planctomycetota bacterium]